MAIYIYIVGVAGGGPDHFQPIQLPIQLVHESDSSEADCEGCDCGEGGDSGEGVFPLAVASWKCKVYTYSKNFLLSQTDPRAGVLVTQINFLCCERNML